MQINTYTRYKLLKSNIPKIISKVIVEDVNVGGVKLTYALTTVRALVFQWFGKQRIIVLQTIPKSQEIKSFLRPYKKSWDSSRNRLPKSLWGNTNEPLTNLWIELESDYKNLQSGMVICKQEIRNTNITKHLSKNKPEFFVFKKSTTLIN